MKPAAIRSFDMEPRLTAGCSRGWSSASAATSNRGCSRLQPRLRAVGRRSGSRPQPRHRSGAASAAGMQPRLRSSCCRGFVTGAAAGCCRLQRSRLPPAATATSIRSRGCSGLQKWLRYRRRPRQQPAAEAAAGAVATAAVSIRRRELQPRLQSAAGAAADTAAAAAAGCSRGFADGCYRGIDPRLQSRLQPRFRSCSHGCRNGGGR